MRKHAAAKECAYGNAAYTSSPVTSGYTIRNLRCLDLQQLLRVLVRNHLQLLLSHQAAVFEILYPFEAILIGLERVVDAEEDVIDLGVTENAPHRIQAPDARCRDPDVLIPDLLELPLLITPSDAKLADSLQ